MFFIELKALFGPIMDTKIHYFKELSKYLFTSCIPTICFVLYLSEIIPVEILYLCLGLFVFTFIIIPVVFKYNYTFQRNIVFLSMVNIPRFADFHNPKNHGLFGTRNFYIETKDKVKLGTWHILPQELEKANLTKEEEAEYYEKSFVHGHHVFVYCHGNSSNRAASHHIELYKILRRHYHVISFDYRGFGDSTGCPETELAVVQDVLTMYNWVKERSSAPVFIWGHSIGTGVSSYAARILETELKCEVAGLVLENPFDNMKNEIAEHPLTLAYKFLPWFRHTMVEPIGKSGFLFQSDEHINHISCPIIILHSEDDMVVPYKLGLRLYTVALEKRSKDKGPIQFKSYDKKFGYGHKFICRDPTLPQLILEFVDQSINQNKIVSL